MNNHFISILKNLHKMFRSTGTINEEIIEMFVDAGADANDLKLIGFTPTDLDDYIYYEALVSQRSEEEVMEEIGL